MIADGVEQNGWFVVNYAPRVDSDDADEFFSYTVGLGKTAGWPELICFGLPEQQARILLTNALADCWKHNTAPRDSLDLHEVVEGFSAKLGAFNAAAPRYFHFADWHADQAGIARLGRLQLLWPDRAGVLPDDDRCDPEVRAKQTPSEAA
ncbi:MAG: DUF4262 domain-containing protein [Sphingomicrobium sp.]